MMIIPNKLIFAFIKRHQIDSEEKVKNFSDIMSKTNCERFLTKNTANIVTNFCSSFGKKTYNFFDKGMVIVHKSNGIRENCYISILNSDSRYFNNIDDFFNDYKEYIDYGGYTYVLDDCRFVCEFITNDKVKAYVE